MSREDTRCWCGACADCLAEYPAAGERELMGLARFTDKELLERAILWRSEPSRDSDTPIYGLALIRELSSRLAATQENK